MDFYERRFSSGKSFEKFIKTKYNPGLQKERKRVTSLDLTYIWLPALPPEISKLINLQLLNLSSSKITFLPPEIGQLIQLQSLNLCNTCIKSLPPEIGQLNQLETLNLQASVV